VQNPIVKIITNDSRFSVEAMDWLVIASDMKFHVFCFSTSKLVSLPISDVHKYAVFKNFLVCCNRSFQFEVWSLETGRKVKQLCLSEQYFSGGIISNTNPKLYLLDKLENTGFIVVNDGVLFVSQVF